MEILFLALGLAVLIGIGFANGANDIAKASASLAGAGVTSLPRAVAWGAAWTTLGGLIAAFWGLAIIKNLSTSVLVGGAVELGSLPVALAVGIAPILWVGLATWRGWPVSTSHAIVGGLMGVGIAAAGMDGVAWDLAGRNIVLPLLASPVMAIVLAYILRSSIRRFGDLIGRYQICLLPRTRMVVSGAAVAYAVNDADASCAVCETGTPSADANIGFSVSEDHLHWMTSGLLSFARGLNDGPKLIAVALPMLALSGQSLNGWLFVFSAFAMGAGGIMAGYRVTEVLAFRVTRIDHHQGFTASLVATVLVLGASRLGLPVSTTHVAASAIMGVGIGTDSGLRMATVKNMLAAWLVTAPLAAVFAALAYGLFGWLGG